MAPRQFGTLTKTSLDAHSTVTQTEFPDDGNIDDLGTPIPPEIDGEETTEVDEFLIAYDIGEAPRCDPDHDNPLVIDIDDGRPGPASNRLGALKRVDTSIRTFSKFNRHTDAWE
jgi:hypothetical protein